MRDGMAGRIGPSCYFTDRECKRAPYYICPRLALLLNSWALTKTLDRHKQSGLLGFATPLFKGGFLSWLVHVTQKPCRLATGTSPNRCCPPIRRTSGR